MGGPHIKPSREVHGAIVALRHAGRQVYRHGNRTLVDGHYVDAPWLIEMSKAEAQPTVPPTVARSRASS